MAKSKSENKKLTSPQGMKTRRHQAHPNAGKHFSPRSLFRGLTVPYSTKPGQKYLYPQLRDKDGRQIMTPKEYKNLSPEERAIRMRNASIKPVRVAHEQG